jgi:catechol 2,3-dioxygenase-like lactoylglutathione lyase family enzyme
MKTPQIVQLAMCTDNMPATIRRYTEVFRFADSGGELLWGDWLAEMQEVDGDLACTIWWLVGSRPFLQLEFFQHTTPAPAPLPADWRPTNLGWVRWGFAVPDFDRCVERARAAGLESYTEPLESAGTRRICFRDPDIGAVIEVIEDGPAVPGGERPPVFEVGPTIVYAAISVADLTTARQFFVDSLGLVEEPSDTLHQSDAGMLWGEEGLTPETMVVRGGDVLLEVVAYPENKGRSQPTRQLVDQGMMNVAFGYRDRADLDELVKSLTSHGHALTNQLGPAPAGAYARSQDGTSIEVLSITADRDGDFGFAPRELKLRPAPSDD